MLPLSPSPAAARWARLLERRAAGHSWLLPILAGLLKPRLLLPLLLLCLIPSRVGADASLALSGSSNGSNSIQGVDNSNRNQSDGGDGSGVWLGGTGKRRFTLDDRQYFRNGTRLFVPVGVN